MNNFVTKSSRWLAALMVVGLLWSATSNPAKAQNYKRHALIEEGTGTWCGYCPFGAYWIDSMKQHMGDALISISWHGPKGYNEPMYIAATDSIASMMKATGYPWAAIGRHQMSAGAYGSFPNPWYTQAVADANEDPLVDFRISNVTFDGSTVECDLDITPFDLKSMPTEDTSAYYTVATLTEDDYVASDAQHRYAYGGLEAATIDDFHHQQVARKVIGKVTGDVFTMGTKTTVNAYPIRRHVKFSNVTTWDVSKLRVKAFAAYKKKTGTLTSYKNAQSGIVFFHNSNYLDAGQTAYLSTLPATAPNGIWGILPLQDAEFNSTDQIRVIWGMGGNTSNAKLEYNVDGGAKWTTIVASTNQSPYLWTPTADAIGHDVSIRVSDASSASLNSIIGPFTVNSGTTVTPQITVTKPAQGESIDAGTHYTITYTTVGEVPATAVAQYSLDGGSQWIDIGPSSSNTVPWIVPDIATTNAQVRVTAGTDIIGMSGIFTIKVATPGAVTDLKVAGAPKVGAKASTKISWTSTGNVGTAFMVDYSTDGQVTWTQITPGQTAKEGLNSYTWVTPDGYFPTVVVRVKSDMGLEVISDNFSIGQAAGVAVAQANGFSLMQNYPNPFNPTTTIPYELAKKSFVTLSIFDLMGREVARPVSGIQNEGPHSIEFNAANLASGTYIYKLSAGGNTLEGRMTLGK